MNNVERSSVHGSLQRICHGMASNISVFALGTALVCCSAGTTTARADSGVTQLQYIQSLVALSGASALFTADSKPSDYVNWATANGMKPSGGWDVNDTLSKKDLAKTLDQLLGGGNSGSGDSSKVLKDLSRAGIDLSKLGDSVSKSDLVGLVDQLGFVPRLYALNAGGTTDKKPTSDKPPTDKPPTDKPPTDDHDKKVKVCHKGHTITISENALNKHLAHGDTLGPCQVTKHSHDRDDDDKDSHGHD